MKASLVLSVLACALSATASSIRRKHSNDADNGAEGFTHHGDTSHLSKYEYHKHYIEETNENPYEGKAAKCVPRSKLEVLLDQYISTFSGIEDGGRTARKTFDEDLKIYSQTRWWITTAVSGDLEKNIEKWAKADSFPPIFENRAQFIKASIRKNNPNQWKKELVIYGCNTFTFFWKGDFSIPEYPTVGRTYGIHMVFVNPKTSRVNRVYSEYNSLNHMYNLGAHITWAKDPALPLLKAAYDRGLNTWDTANSYSNGISEVIVGKAIKDYDIPREKLVILTKCNFAVGETPEEQQFTFYSEFDRSKDYQNQFGLSRIAIFNQVEASLKRLGTTYIDLLQIHRFDSSVPIEETLKALHDLVQSGKVRYIGASSMWATQFAQLQFCAEKNGWTKFVSMQDQYNLLYREEEREMIRFCNETGVGLIPWAPLCRGYLARPPSDSTARASIESDLTSGGHGTSKVDLEIIGRVTELAKKREWPMAHVALAWINKRVTSPIIGCSSIKRIDEAVGSSGKVLTDEEERYLEELYQPRPIWGHI